MMFLLLPVFCMGLLCACGQEPAKQATKRKTVTASKTMAMEKKYDKKLTGVIKGIEEDTEILTILEIATAAETVLTYNDMTEATNKYGDIKTVEQFSIGDIVEVYFWSENNEIVKIKNFDSSWTYEDVKKFTIRREDKLFKIADHRYQYDPVSLLVIQDGKLTDLLTINEYDTLRVQGVGRHIYSITVKKGHGYVRFKNYEQFVGGMVEIGYGVIRNVSQDMLLTVPEGTYRMVMEHGRLFAEKQITVEQGQELTIDLGAYQTEVDKTGRVYFIVEPEGAQLNINGVPTVYTEEAVELNFGKNIIQVFAEGYMPYTGTLNVKKAYQVVKIHLAQDSSDAEVVSTSDEDSSDTEGQDNDSSSDNTENNITHDNNTDSDDNTEEDNNHANASSGSSVTEQDKKEEKEPDNQEESEKDKDQEKEEDSQDTTIKPADTESIEIDKKHTITVNAPASVKVYVNGDYVGKSPVSFHKMIGTFTVALSKNGYKTASYTLTMEDDGESSFLSFPDLVEEE